MKLKDEWGNTIAHAEIGWRAPTVCLQITPFSWGFGYTREWKRHNRHIGAQLGPISISLNCTGLGTLSRSLPGHFCNTQVWKDGGWK